MPYVVLNFNPIARRRIEMNLSGLAVPNGASSEDEQRKPPKERAARPLRGSAGAGKAPIRQEERRRLSSVPHWPAAWVLPSFKPKPVRLDRYDPDRIYKTLRPSIRSTSPKRAEGRPRPRSTEIIRGRPLHARRRRQAAGEDRTSSLFRRGEQTNRQGHIKGVVCGIRVERSRANYAGDPLSDKLIDELAKGKEMEKILQDDGGPTAGGRQDADASRYRLADDWAVILDCAISLASYAVNSCAGFRGSRQ